MKIAALVRRRKKKGSQLYPDRCVTGTYVASSIRFDEDYIRLEYLDLVVEMLNSDSGLRMGNPEAGITAPTQISRQFIEVK